MSVYTEEDTTILFSILKKEKPDRERDSINFRNKNDSKYTIYYDHETLKLTDVNKYNVLISGVDGKRCVLDYQSSPKTIIYSLLCLETSNFTSENSKMFRSFVKEFIKNHYNYCHLQEIYNSKINVEERIDVFLNSKNDFSQITETIIFEKEKIANKLASTANPKIIKRLEAKIKNFDTKKLIPNYQE